MNLLSQINKSINEERELNENILKGLEIGFKLEDHKAVCETAADVLKSALQDLQAGKDISDPAVVGGLLVLAKGQVRKDLDIGPQKLGLIANYAGRSDRINQELRSYGAGAKIDVDRLARDENYKADILGRLEKLVGAYDRIAQQAGKDSEQIQAQAANPAPSYPRGI